MQFVGCKKAKEVTLTRTPAQPLAAVLVRKSLEDPQSQQTSEIDMDIDIAKRLVSMPEVTKTFFAGLETEAAKAFLAKPAEEQDKEAEAVKKLIDDAAAEKTRQEEAAKALNGETSEAMKALRNENEALKARFDATERTHEIEKMAGSADFHGYPGGEEACKKNLELAFKAGGELKDAMIETMKTSAKMAKTMGSTEFGGRSEHDALKSAPKTAEVYKAADERAKTNGTTRSDELVKMAKEPAWKEAVGAAMNEAA